MVNLIKKFAYRLVRLNLPILKFLFELSLELRLAWAQPEPMDNINNNITTVT